LVVDDGPRVADQSALEAVPDRRLENSCASGEFADSDSFDTRALPGALIALERKEDHEGEHYREHGADHRQRACATRRVGEPAADGRSAAHEKLGGGRSHN